MKMSYRVQATLSFLPAELIRQICGYLNIADILSLELTDGQLRQLIGEGGVWRDVVLRWRDQVKCSKQRKLVEQMVDILGKKGLQETRHYKIVLGILRQTKKILLVVDSDRYLTFEVGTQAWVTYLSVVRHLVAQFITEERKLIVGARRKEMSELWFVLNTPLAYVRGGLYYYKPSAPGYWG
eukprot:GFUD01020312.1.p1 GENE.GFUD01020312.1~~GFUD01020312.1.p1  ORF type:complete len:182 (+),score=11.45 GFUD01020312.1:98-643(+)